MNSPRTQICDFGTTLLFQYVQLLEVAHRAFGEYICNLHGIQRWFWNKTDSSIHHVRPEGMTEVFVVGQKPNQFSYSHSQTCQKHNAICSVQPTLEGDHWRLLSTAMIAPQDPTPRTFVDVLRQHVAMGAHGSSRRGRVARARNFREFAGRGHRRIVYT
jgi:hypothetical protein